jgi:dephospho-CoA kinase
MPSTKLVVGLTGGIGSGKSTVADLFHSLGVTVIDTDQLARDVVEPHTAAFDTIVKRFGETVVSAQGGLNRKALREMIFADPLARKWLEELLHPLIRAEMARQVTAATSPYCIAVIPLLFETTPNPLINRILVVDAKEDLQIKRATDRDKESAPKIEAILANQASRDTRLQGADDVIYNDKHLADLIPQVEKLHELYLSLVKL